MLIPSVTTPSVVLFLLAVKNSSPAMAKVFVKVSANATPSAARHLSVISTLYLEPGIINAELKVKVVLPCYLPYG